MPCTGILGQPNTFIFFGEDGSAAYYFDFWQKQWLPPLLIQIPAHLLSVRWNKAHVHISLRSFAATKSELARVQKKKRRLNEVCLERFQQYSQTFIQSWILQGKVLVDEKVVSKCGTPIFDKAVLEIGAEVPKCVCKAGHNLEAVIEQLEIDVAGKVELDLGLSTGGFTDCLLQFGASFVYGVDVDMEIPK
ncbi:hemolysin A isoform X1 [Olea europaea subsp. europaea]|uniref:Hemolysin A isoform X1 n=1 Tax=Olea europaea subsp. europaea TaxID=158383 RepID=A0A8S0PE11_OLEEU|nr:hemolysin A isoform X1 [Olea europaea subsp. europaea]